MHEPCAEREHWIRVLGTGVFGFQIGFRISVFRYLCTRPAASENTATVGGATNVFLSAGVAVGEGLPEERDFRRESDLRRRAGGW